MTVRSCFLSNVYSNMINVICSLVGLSETSESEEIYGHKWRTGD